MPSLHPDTVTALLARHAAKRDLTMEGMLLELDAAGFWPSGWPLARRLAHQRRVLRGRMRVAGVPRLLLQPSPLPAWITDDHARTLLSCLGEDWIDLERIRGNALSMHWFPPSLRELGQVLALEATVGTERGWSHPALQDSEGPFVVGVWDSESSPTPIVVYKHCEAWTSADAARIIEHVRAQTAEQQAEVRALRDSVSDRPGNRVGPNHHATPHGAS
jgi:hypothetical protein